MPLLPGQVELQPGPRRNPTRGLAPEAPPTRPRPLLTALRAASHGLRPTPVRPQASVPAASPELTTSLVAKRGVCLVPAFRAQEQSPRSSITTSGGCLSRCSLAAGTGARPDTGPPSFTVRGRTVGWVPGSTRPFQNPFSQVLGVPAGSQHLVRGQGRVGLAV